jgi:hydroxyacid-oxoacid transhydrogenase
MRDLDIPNGLGAVGFSSDDIPALVKGTMPQQRITKLAARPNDEKDIARMFEDAMKYW